MTWISKLCCAQWIGTTRWHVRAGSQLGRVWVYFLHIPYMTTNSSKRVLIKSMVWPYHIRCSNSNRHFLKGHLGASIKSDITRHHHTFIFPGCHFTTAVAGGGDREYPWLQGSANIGTIWGRQDPGGPHVVPMNFAIWDLAPHILGWVSK